MEDDLVIGLTRQVKEEVIEHYFMERRLIELQIEHLNGLAAEARTQAWIVGRRLARLSFLMLHPEMRNRLGEIFHTGRGYFWIACLNMEFTRYVRLIRVKALTRKGKFRKLVLESYSRLYCYMEGYRRQFEDLECECAAVNCNIESFHKNFDLLSILSFLRNIDMQGIEKKKILGENFTAKEMASLDENLYIAPVSMEKLDAPAPLDLPDPVSIREKLARLADDVFHRYGDEARRIMR